MRSSLSRFRELRRGLPLVAAGLLLVALAVPMWRITLSAPQYPGQELVLKLYAYPRLGGDFMEVHALNKYVGFYYPDPVYVEPNFPTHPESIRVPEWLLGPVAFVAVAGAGVFVSLAPTDGKLKRGLQAQLVGTLLTFAGMFAIIQVRLYQAGHSLDPDAPLRGVEGFTPPVLGGYQVANISGFAWFGPGGYLTMVAVALLGAAYLARNSEATFRDLPGILRDYREGLDRGKERVTTRLGGD